MPPRLIELPQPTVTAPCEPLQAEPPGPAAARTVAAQFAALGDPVRLRLLSLVATARGGAVCACDLVGAVGRSQPTVSHHLRTLREAGLVVSERRGANVWYAAVPAALQALADVLSG